MACVCFAILKETKSDLLLRVDILFLQCLPSLCMFWNTVQFADPVEILRRREVEENVRRSKLKAKAKEAEVRVPHDRQYHYHAWKIHSTLCMDWISLFGAWKCIPDWLTHIWPIPVDDPFHPFLDNIFMWFSSLSSSRALNLLDKVLILAHWYTDAMNILDLFWLSTLFNLYNQFHWICWTRPDFCLIRIISIEWVQCWTRPNSWLIFVHRSSGKQSVQTDGSDWLHNSSAHVSAGAKASGRNMFSVTKTCAGAKARRDRKGTQSCYTPWRALSWLSRGVFEIWWEWHPNSWCEWSATEWFADQETSQGGLQAERFAWGSHEDFTEAGLLSSSSPVREPSNT